MATHVKPAKHTGGPLQDASSAPAAAPRVAHIQRYVKALQGAREKVLLMPPHEQQLFATLLNPIFTHAAVHAPVVVEPRSFRPKVGSIDTTSPTFWKPI